MKESDKMTKGLTKSKVIEISKNKNEPKWMRDFRVKSYEEFKKQDNPLFGPEIRIDFDEINYYKKVSEQVDDWNKVPSDVKNIFDKIGLPDAEKKYLAGVGAQFESEVIYHNLHAILIECHHAIACYLFISFTIHTCRGRSLYRSRSLHRSHETIINWSNRC